MVKFRKTKNGETRSIKSKAKYRLQMFWVMVASPTVFLVMLLVCPSLVIQSPSETQNHSFMHCVRCLCRLNKHIARPKWSFQYHSFMWCVQNWSDKISSEIRKHFRLIYLFESVPHLFLKMCSPETPSGIPLGAQISDLFNYVLFFRIMRLITCTQNSRFFFVVVVNLWECWQPSCSVE